METLWRSVKTFFYLKNNDCKDCKFSTGGCGFVDNFIFKAVYKLYRHVKSRMLDFLDQLIDLAFEHSVVFDFKFYVLDGIYYG